jgi:hypothetical protein
MKHIRRRTTRAILVPFALFVLAVGAMPANAASLDGRVAPSHSFCIAGISLNW